MSAPVMLNDRAAATATTTKIRLSRNLVRSGAVKHTLLASSDEIPMVIAAAGTFVWLMAFSVPYPLLLGIFVGLFDLIPVVGSTIAGVVVAAVALTAREYDVLRQLAQGRDVHRCATALGLSLYTTRDHIKALMGKLSAHSQLVAVVAADRLGLISVGSRY